MPHTYRIRWNTKTQGQKAKEKTETITVKQTKQYVETKYKAKQAHAVKGKASKRQQKHKSNKC